MCISMPLLSSSQPVLLFLRRRRRPGPAAPPFPSPARRLRASPSAQPLRAGAATKRSVALLALLARLPRRGARTAPRPPGTSEARQRESTTARRERTTIGSASETARVCVLSLFSRREKDAACLAHESNVELWILENCNMVRWLRCKLHSSYDYTTFFFIMFRLWQPVCYSLVLRCSLNCLNLLLT